MMTEVIKETKGQIRRSKWAAQVKEQQESGLSVTSWCKEHGVKTSTFFSRLRSLREAALQHQCLPASLSVEHTSFAEITLANLQGSNRRKLSLETETTIKITLPNATLEIPNTASTDLAILLLKAVNQL